MTSYEEETDYRNIPSELLDSNIPVGRGMIKWAPFATLPEQFETIQQYIIDQNKITRPVLSDDQLAELNIRLHEALQYAQPVEVKFYNNGFVDSVRLTIYRIDAINYEIDGYVYNQQQRQKISIFDILDIVLLP
ncbi:TPA: YolD-like family protein [Staphylococcus aureus]|uniref:YolD-like family protein n=2 Tax=Staphylococcus aureus TaxID=1280 RepID=A0A0U1MPZ4_STAAU|nr:MULTISPECIES: YolD-like family protein [Staphylococcus]HDK8974844.1 YolD-like family protein [Staphylococcus aureus USA600-NRS22]HDK9079132.1 YolD-like family protein [Staphylococcus aureus USA600-BAA1754]HDK9081733.1 YolD-like family protein [Staphylococcus aureus USA600-BAA1751]HDQ3543843.1 YolD-like family protein [Staphylococcus aureus USA600-NY-315]AGO30323.1 yolD-like family protein [Staphylococcus aureus CA-347]